MMMCCNHSHRQPGKMYQVENKQNIGDDHRGDVTPGPRSEYKSVFKPLIGSITLQDFQPLQCTERALNHQPLIVRSM